MKRPTPHLDAWRPTAIRALAEFGRKAELARHLSQIYGRPPRSWETNISQILAGTLVPNAEVFLAISAWIDRHKAEKPPKSANRRSGR